jgi:hypothetical protein
MGIIFGTKKLGVADNAYNGNAKYPEMAVITVEAAKEAGKSRRILFNEKAAELLSLENGFIQHVAFGAVTDGVNRLLVNNVSNMDIPEGAEITSYKTSKNKVSFEDSKEKGKAITSSRFAKEIIDFLSLDDSEQHEFRITEYDSTEINAFGMDLIADFSNEEYSEESTVESDDVDAVSAVNAVETSQEEEVPQESGIPQRREVAVEQATTNWI